MHSFIFNNRSTHCSDSLQYLVLRLPALTYSGLVDQAASPPIFFLVCLSRLYICLFWVFFSRCISSTLYFWRNLEESAPFLRVPPSIFGVWCFLEEALKSLRKILAVSMQAGLSFPSDLIRSIHSCLWVSNCPTACMVAFMCALACPLVPGFLGGLQISRKY